MAANTQVVISDCAIHVNGVAVLGGPNEVTIEEIKAKTIDSNSLAMQGTVEYTTGIEKMAMMVKLNHVDSSVIGKFCDIYNSVQIQVRAAHRTFGPGGMTALVPLVYKITATSKTVMPGFSHKAQEKAEFEANFSVSAITCELDGQEIMKFDALANIHNVNGVDKLASLRAVLGI